MHQVANPPAAMSRGASRTNAAAWRERRNQRDRNRAPWDRVFRLVPEGRIGLAIEVEVRVRSEDPLLADGALPLAEGVFEIPGANAGRKVSFRGAP